MSSKDITKPDKLLRLLREYRSETVACKAMAVALRLSDKQITSWLTRNEKILEEASRTPAQCAESALAALDTVIEELSDSRDRVRERILRLTQAARNYFASTL